MGGGCDHIRSLDLFIESVHQAILKECKFVGRPWNLETLRFRETKRHDVVYPEMGINAEFNYRDRHHSSNPFQNIFQKIFHIPERLINTYHVSTTPRKPYCSTEPKYSL